MYKYPIHKGTHTEHKASQPASQERSPPRSESKWVVIIISIIIIIIIYINGGE